MASVSNPATSRQRTKSASDHLKGLAPHSPSLSPSTPKLVPSPRLSPTKPHAVSAPPQTQGAVPAAPLVPCSKSKEARNAEFLQSQLALIKDELRGISEFESDESEMADLRLQVAELQTKLQAQCADGHALRANTHAEQQGLRIKDLEIQLQEWMAKATRRSHDEELWEQRESQSARLKDTIRVLTARTKKLETKLRALATTYAEQQKQSQTLADEVARLQGEHKTLDTQIVARKAELAALLNAGSGDKVTPQDMPRPRRAGSAKVNKKENDALKKEIAAQKKEIAALNVRLAKSVVAPPASAVAPPPPARLSRWDQVNEAMQIQLIAFLTLQLLWSVVRATYAWQHDEAS